MSDTDKGIYEVSMHIQDADTSQIFFRRVYTVRAKCKSDAEIKARVLFD